MQRGTAGVAMADADCHATLSDRPGGRAGRKRPASCRPQPLVDRDRFHPANQSDRPMGLRLRPVARS